VSWLYVGSSFSRAAEMIAEGWEFAGADPRYGVAFGRVWMRRAA
jgi:hypothetical protein